MQLIIACVFLLSMGVLTAGIERRAHGIKVTHTFVIAELLSCGVVLAMILAVVLPFNQNLGA